MNISLPSPDDETPKNATPEAASSPNSEPQAPEEARLSENASPTADDPVRRRDRVQLPSPAFLLIWSAVVIFTSLAKRLELFMHADAVSEVVSTGPNQAEVRALTPSAFRSRAELAGELWRDGVDNKGKRISRPSRCSEVDAKGLLATRAARDLLPPLTIVSAAPILTVNLIGQPRLLGYGYSRALDGVYVTSRETPRDIPLPEAVKALISILRGFWFATPGDRARAVAALLIPALVYGRLLGESRVPMVVVEANKSQTGKGYLVALIAAIYGERPNNVVPRKGGVGSFDEDFSAALLRACAIIMLDNLKGLLDSSHIESFMTAMGPFYARPVRRAAAPVDRTRYVIFATSNGFEGTADMENRAMRIMLLKRPKDRPFRNYKGLDVLEYVRAHQPFYQGCVFSVVRAWIEAGRPTTGENRHSFRACMGSLDWMLLNVFGSSVPGRLLDFDEVPCVSEDAAEELGFEPPDDTSSDLAE